LRWDGSGAATPCLEQRGQRHAHDVRGVVVHGWDGHLAAVEADGHLAVHVDVGDVAGEQGTANTPHTP